MVRQFLVDKLKFSETRTVLFQACHRLPVGDESKPNIIVRFLNLRDRDDAMKAAYKLPRGSGYGVTPDLNPEASKLRTRLINERKELPAHERNHTKIVYMKSYPFVMLRRF